VSREAITEALGALDDLTRRLRVECPWDREQDERSIVPHTVEEAYELADAALSGDDAKLLDELGDVLFQVHFLALLLEERGAGDLAAVAEHCRQKLIRRHPHVFGEVEVENAGQVLANWDKIKETEEGRERGVFAEIPENLPGPLLARKVQRRAASSGFDPLDADERLDAARGALEAIAEGGATDESIGDALFALVNVARGARVDPELALRASSQRFRGRVEAAVELAAAAGERWSDLTEERRLDYYVRGRMNEATLNQDQESPERP
jgi:MazG family protein